MADEQKPTSGRQWRKPREEGFLLELPSGNAARIGPVALDTMIASGDIPDLLTPIAARMVWTEIDTDQAKDDGTLAKELVELMAIVCKAAFRQPRIVDNPQEDDEISLADLSSEDKAWVFALAMQPARALQTFCEKQAQGLGAVPDSEDDGEPAE